MAFAAALFVGGSQGYAADKGNISRELDELGFAELATERFHFHLGVPTEWLLRDQAHFEDAHADVTRWARSMGFVAEDEQSIHVVMFKTGEEFATFTRRIGLACGDVAGFYAVEPDLLLFVWSEFAPAMQLTIRHEVAHAVLYRTGVHRHDVTNPPWLVEGLACMFEVDQKEGDAGLIPNPWRLEDLRPLFPRELHCGRVLAAAQNGLIEDLISTTRPLDEGDGSHSERYALAYSLVWYLNKTNPDGLKRYLNGVSARSAEADDPPAWARSEFTTEFGPVDEGFVRGWRGATCRLITDHAPP